MNAKDKMICDAKVSVLKAIAHPTRLSIVEMLANGEHCVCEFTDVFSVDFSTVSKHLSVLKKAGIVQDDKRGKQVFYRLKMTCILEFVSCLESALISQIKETAALID
jgi:DNA-binding transcriptional ArsR family regulator